MDDSGKVKPTRKEAERKAFWKRALAVGGAVIATVMGIVLFRKRPKRRKL